MYSTSGETQTCGLRERDGMEKKKNQTKSRIKQQQQQQPGVIVSGTSKRKPVPVGIFLARAAIVAVGHVTREDVVVVAVAAVDRRRRPDGAEDKKTPLPPPDGRPFMEFLAHCHRRVRARCPLSACNLYNYYYVRARARAPARISDKLTIMLFQISKNKII